jgi:hypothetical protein
MKLPDPNDPNLDPTDEVYIYYYTNLVEIFIS